MANVFHEIPQAAIAFSITCGIACVPIALWCVRDIRDSGLWALLPHSFSTLLLLAMAAAPWGKAVGRFSVRTLHSGMTLLAVVPGMALYATN